MSGLQGGGGRPAPLTDREIATWGLLAAGLTNGAIAARLHLSRGSVKNIVRGLLARWPVAPGYSARTLLLLRWYGQLPARAVPRALAAALAASQQVPRGT